MFREIYFAIKALIAIACGVYRAFLASFLWLWFVVPIGTNIMILNTPHMYGLFLLWTFFDRSEQTQKLGGTTFPAYLCKMTLKAVVATVVFLIGFLISYAI